MPETTNQCAYCHRIKHEEWVKKDPPDKNTIVGCICRDCVIEETRKLALRARKSLLANNSTFQPTKINNALFEQYSKSAGEVRWIATKEQLAGKDD